MSRQITRRRFVSNTAGLAVVSALGVDALAGRRRKRTAVDQVRLGATGLRLSRLGIGCGSKGGSIQRALGQEEFTKLIRYAYDQGITYIDTADSYKTHEMVKEAIKGLPREKLFIQTKMPGRPENPAETIDRYRKELGVDYIDSLLTHCATTDDWDEQRKPILEALEQAKQNKIIRAHGVSCHSLPALKVAAKAKWVDVNLVRINPQGTHMDTPAPTWDAKSDQSHVDPVLEQIATMRKNGHGVIGMKIIGNGDFTNADDREKSIRSTFGRRLVHAAAIGFKSPAEIDEAIQRINNALAQEA